MKRAVYAFIILAALSVCRAHAAYPQVQDRGAVEVGTITCVAIGTTPVLALSTGTNVIEENAPQFNVFKGTESLPTAGANLVNRVHLEFFNDTAVDAYIGYSVNVSSQPGVNYGRRVPAGAAWSHDCSVKEHWIVGGSTSTQKFVITQER